MRITPAGATDIPDLCQLLALLFAEEAEFRPDGTAQAEGLRQIITSPENGQILVLRDGQVAIGMVNLLFVVSTALGGRVAILEDMVVRPSHRGSGAGTTLLQAAIDVARQAGCRRITLLTDQANEPAQRFYERHGFSFSDMIPMRRSL
jgi:GNAT superfamily N-acetyltransferase